jgi:Lon protease-like protein
VRLPLFPLRSVLCPGVALPLHIFEERYRLMVGRCIERSEPFGVVLIREGREVGPLDGRLADIGTTALIRQAGRYPDGRMDIVTVGGQRFRIQALDPDSEPYLMGDVTLLRERVGGDREADLLRRRVGQRFLRYLELLQPALGDASGPEIEVEVEIEAPDDVLEPDEEQQPEPLAVGSLEAGGAPESLDATGLSDDQRRELLMAAAKRLTATDDPTALSYLLTGLIQVDLGARQDLLEAPDTVGRLVGLDALLRREIGHLSRHLRPIVLDPAVLALRRN